MKVLWRKYLGMTHLIILCTIVLYVIKIIKENTNIVLNFLDNDRVYTVLRNLRIIYAFIVAKVKPKRHSARRKNE